MVRINEIDVAIDNLKIVLKENKTIAGNSIYPTLCGILSGILGISNNQEETVKYLNNMIEFYKE